ncbi:uncharacterized protein EI90DRAFT_66138 [Cantharellus anzutake]|uniref:uncharacterized protein n=1 Tax=Cantharellus anzutake TaxID=1750568 RepID=UPI001903CA65|nr:uncharacterized protein EI90DRAFT_66138 [Cantharellus anzutake]KAF8344287.1 hypothetical protein EI90DRAFT_66138 [Cantharellus anzutake]
MEHLKSLGNWWLRQFAKEDKETVTIQAPPLKHQLISDIKAEDLASSVYNKYIYCDLFFEVLEDFDSSYGFKARDIYITDYTRNPLNKYHPLHEDLALKVSLWKSDREPEKPEIIIEKGKLYRHRNLRVKHSPQGCLEGKINLGSESDKISRIPWVCENERFAAFKECVGPFSLVVMTHDLQFQAKKCLQGSEQYSERPHKSRGVSSLRTERLDAF